MCLKEDLQGIYHFLVSVEGIYNQMAFNAIYSALSVRSPGVMGHHSIEVLVTLRSQVIPALRHQDRPHYAM
jgi:hypothetical protein